MSMDKLEEAMHSTPEDIAAAARPTTKMESGIRIPDSKDPWVHRTDTMLCRTCMFFVSKELSESRLISPVGRCRRHAPTMSGYPVVFPNDWCGDHKLDENKA